MRVINTLQIETPLSVVDTKDELIFEVKEYHIEIELEDGSVVILENAEEYYNFIGDANVTTGPDEVLLDKLMDGDCKITIVNYELENGDTINAVCEVPYNNKNIYILQVNKADK